MKRYGIWVGVVCLTVALNAVVAAGPADVKKVEGVLLDKDSSDIAETRIVGNGRLEGGILQAYLHTRKELLTPAHQKSGYGVFAHDDQKFFSFDAAGNSKALALIRAAKKEDDFRVEVTGTIEGEKMKVTAIRLLP